MKLWIRSQNKSVLKEATILNYFYSDKKHCIDCNGYCVGYYESKERCLEIIDEIQKLLEKGNPENAFYHIHNVDIPYDELAELFKRVRKEKAIATEGATFDVIMPSVITYEMPIK